MLASRLIGAGCNTEDVIIVTSAHVRQLANQLVEGERIISNSARDRGTDAAGLQDKFLFVRFICAGLDTMTRLDSSGRYRPPLFVATFAATECCKSIRSFGRVRLR